MALPSIIFKAELHISDMDRHYYQTHNITVARHPSETDERMMMRMLAFALNASDRLVFANGLSASDEPDLWEKDYTGAISLWIMVGLPDEKQIKKACSRSEKVIIYCYGGGAVDTWWKNINVDKLVNLSIVNVSSTTSEKLAHDVLRTMSIQCTIEDKAIWWSNKDGTSEVELTMLKQFSVARK